MKKCLCIKTHDKSIYFKLENVYSYKISTEEQQSKDDMYSLYPYIVNTNKIGLTSVMFSKKQFYLYFKDIQEIRKEKINSINQVSDDKLWNYWNNQILK